MKSLQCCVNGQKLAMVDSDNDSIKDCCAFPTVTYADLVACTGEKKQNQTVAHAYDGCSLPDVLAGLVGDKENPCGKIDTSFYTCCGNPALPVPSHDNMYQTCGYEKASADVELLLCMRDVCDNASPANPDCGYAFEADCRDMADYYYIGLVLGGESAYETRQLQYCLCCMTED